MPDWVVDWLSDPLTALFAVYVTDVVVDWLNMSLNSQQSYWLSDRLVCCLGDWLTCNGGADSTPDWMVDWATDSLTALFAVDVTDLVEDWCKAWLSGVLS